MRGFFGFLVVFVMLILLLLVSVNENNFYSELGEAKTILIEAEQGSKEKTIIENNVDKIVFEKLKEQVLQKNFLIESIMFEINNPLSSYLSTRTTANIIGTKIGPVNTEFLTLNSIAFLIEKEGVTYAEYTFTGGLLKTNTVSHTFGEKIEIEFVIPADYTVRVVG